MKIVKSVTIALSLGLLSLSVSAHNGHGDELPWQACADAQKDEACQYTNSHNDRYIGNCKVFSGALMCVRNKPIVHLEKLTLFTTVELQSGELQTRAPSKLDK
ncbi:hypothetical protein [Paraglaciecola marina]|uniref:hypothetical protein n=1 Tax=Paraglaciecola marina TaxID=2500157 RepID=UPI00105FE457|nr:hypothetical protein [Paraglaciecola marina]